HLIWARFDEDDGAGRADQPNQRTLQGDHAGRACNRRRGPPGCRRIRHHALTLLKLALVIARSQRVRPLWAGPMINSATKQSRMVSAEKGLDCFASLAMTSIRVLVLGQKCDRRLPEDVEVEQHGPVLDVVQIEFHALLDLLFIVDLATPAVDL